MQRWLAYRLLILMVPAAALLMAAIPSPDAAATDLHTAIPLSLAAGSWHALLGSSLVLAVLGKLDLRPRFAPFFAGRKKARPGLMRQLFERSPHGAVVVGADRRIVAINPAACAILRLGRGRAHEGRAVEDVLPPRVCEAMVTLLRSSGPGDETAGADETRHVGADGTIIDIEYALAPQFAAKPGAVDHDLIAGERLVACFFRDFTERARAERAAREAGEEAMAANRAKTRFLADMGHELRTPLNAIIGFSEIMRDELFGPLGSPRYIETATEIHSGGVTLLEMLDRVLDMARLDSGAFHLDQEEIRLADVFETVRAVVARWPQGAEREIRIEEPPGGLTVVADFRLLKEILLQLLSNAVKFTGPGGRVSVACERDRASGFRIVVSDDGIGISEQARAEITRPFYRGAGGRDRSVTGAGLGLALVEAYVRALGGTMEIRSKPGEGTRVLVRLPAQRLADDRAATEKAGTLGAAG